MNLNQKRILLVLLSSFVICSLFSVHAESNSQEKYLAIIDAGSSGSRLYFYQMTRENGEPQAKEIKIEKNTVEPGLYTYIKKPELVSDHFKDLFEGLKTISSKMNLKSEQISVYVFSTAGMRIASPNERKKLYDSSVKYMKDNGYKDVDVRMITGHIEGLFAWVAANYLNKTFSEEKKSIGIIDLGGGSTQIAFETSEENFFVSAVRISEKTYTVYSRSYLGLGMDYARYQFSMLPECWPKGYPMPGSHIKADPDFAKGVKDFSLLISLFHHLPAFKNLEAPEDISFIGISGFYYITVAKAVKLNKTFTLKDIQKAGTAFSKRTWEELEKEYPDDPYLFAHLINLELMTALLKYGFDFPSDKQIQACSKINGITVSPSLGAALYIFEGNELK